MVSPSIRHMTAAALVLSSAIGTATFAQESDNRVAASTDWSVFVETNPRECWAVSAPKTTVNTRGGEVVSVRRGDVLMFVFYRPGSSVSGQVAFTGGYPFADGSTVSLKIGSNEFSLYSDGEWAWPASPEEDAKVVAAMKRGSDAVLTARSGRGTQTQDTFSLRGFTAGIEEAAKRCGT